MVKAKQRYPTLAKLKGKLREKRYTYKMLSEEICLGIDAICRKINGQWTFSTDEIERICKILRIPAEEIPEYFFPGLLTKGKKTA